MKRINFNYNFAYGEDIKHFEKRIRTLTVPFIFRILIFLIVFGIDIFIIQSCFEDKCFRFSTLYFAIFSLITLYFVIKLFLKIKGLLVLNISNAK